MPRTWCVLQTQDMEDIWQPPLYSEVGCLPKKLMNKCLTSKIKTPLTLLNGFLTTSSHPFVIFLPKAWRWLSLSLETQLLFKKCLRELLSNSLLCLEEKLSCIGILEKVNILGFNIFYRYGRNGIHWSRI